MRYLLLIVFLFSFSLQCSAQKVKYKDLYVLLFAKRYEEAEPFLRTFLSDDKNNDHANAHMHMANIFAFKSENADMLADDNLAINYADSAVLYYEKALKLIDDKEIRKNDEFYEEYIRRDLRSGKVGITLSDIHFDLQKKIEALQQRKKQAASLKEYYDNFTTAYQKSAKAFKEIQSKYPDITTFLLRADENTTSSLELIRSEYESARSNFKSYKNVISENANSGHNLIWNEKPVSDFSVKIDSVDFRSNSVTTYNLGQWAKSNFEIINKDVELLRKNILEFDLALHNMENKLKSSAISGAELSDLNQKLLALQLDKYDQQSLPLNLFKMQLAELEYLSSRKKYISNKDSANVFYQLNEIGLLQQKLNTMDSMVNIIIGMDLNKEALNYTQFIEARYSSADKLQQFVKAKLDFVLDEGRVLAKEMENATRASRYMVHLEDTMPIFMDGIDSMSFLMPVQVVEEKYSVGLKMPNGRLSGVYFTDINRSRRSKVKVDITLDTLKFQAGGVEITEILAANDPEEQIFFILVFQPTTGGTKYNAVVSKIYKVDGIAWTKTFNWDKKPVEAFYQPDTGDLSVSLEDGVNYTITKDGDLK